MSLSYSGPHGWVEQRWIVYALLRDCVQHHLEDGHPSGQFDALHSISQALGGDKVAVPAKKLHEELVLAKKKLAGRSIDDLAISSRTRAVISLQALPTDPRTVLVSEWGGVVPMLGGRPKTLDDVFGHLMDELLRISEGATTENVEITEL